MSNIYAKFFASTSAITVSAEPICRRKSRFIISVLTGMAVVSGFAGAPKDEDHVINLGNWIEPENNV